MTCTANDAPLARAVTRLLGSHRANAYSSWIRVGFALHAIDPSVSMREEFHRFSARTSGGNYALAATDKFWDGIRDRGSGAVTLGTLIAWAREDAGGDAVDAAVAAHRGALLQTCTGRPASAGGTGRVGTSTPMFSDDA